MAEAVIGFVFAALRALVPDMNLLYSGAGCADKIFRRFFRNQLMFPKSR